MEFLRCHLFRFRFPFLPLRAGLVVLPDLLDLIKVVRNLCSGVSWSLGYHLLQRRHNRGIPLFLLFATSSQDTLVQLGKRRLISDLQQMFPDFHFYIF